MIWSGWKLTQPQRVHADGEAERQYQRSIAQYRLKSDALAILELHAPGASEGQQGLSLSDVATSTVFETLHETDSSASLRTQHNFLVKGLERGAHRLGWQVNIPGPLVTLPRRSPPVTTERFSELEPWDAIVNVHDAMLCPENMGAASLKKWLAGRLVFQLIREGAVLHQRWLEAIPAAVVHGITLEANTVFLTLPSVPSNATGSVGTNEPEDGTADPSLAETSTEQMLEAAAGVSYRRLFLSPVSQLLLLNYYQRVGQTWSSRASGETCFFHYAKHMAPASPPRSLSWFISAAQTSTSMDMLPLLTHYASSTDAAPSLRPSAWHRLTTGQVPSLVTVGSDAPESGRWEYVPVPSKAPELPDQLRQLRTLQRCFSNANGSKNDSKTACRNIEQFLKEFDANGPIMTLLAGWALALMQRGGRVKNTLAVSTVTTYLSHIARPLIVHGHGIHAIQTLDAGEWQALYDRVLSDIQKASHRARVQNRLRYFHNYVIDTQAAPEVELEIASSSKVLVDTNIITPAEYQRAVGLIDTSQQPERFRIMQKLALILGYRLGLRRSECASLLIRDVTYVFDHDEMLGELLIRANRFHKGKTHSATRRLPLWLLMPEEKRQLLGWCQRRREESTTKAAEKDLLLCRSGSGALPLGDKEIFKPIQTALKAVSGDASVRYHHLRHSFVSFTLLRLLERTPGELLPLDWLRDDQGHFAMPNTDADISAQAGLAPQSSPTRKRLWQLALWAGHASPDETLGTYSHLVDWIVGHELQQRINPLVTIDMQLELLNARSRSSLTSWRGRHKLRRKTYTSDLLEPVKNDWKHYRAAVPLDDAWQPYQAPAINPLNVATTAAFEWPEAITIYQSLRLIEQQEYRGIDPNTAVEQTARRFVVDPDQLTKWVKNGEQLMQQKTRRNHQRFSRREQPERRDELAAAQHLYMPELHRCMAPPIKPEVLKEAGQFFHQLLDWHQEHTAEAEESLVVFRRHMQRSTGHITLPDAHAICCIRRMLKPLRCMTHTQLVVEVEKSANEKQVKRYWAQETDIPQRHIELTPSTSASGRTRHWYGNADLKITREASHSSTQQPLWEAVRFSAFMALLVLGLTGSKDSEVDTVDA